jgi:hypothetical protein
MRDVYVSRKRSPRSWACLLMLVICGGCEVNEMEDVHVTRAMPTSELILGEATHVALVRVDSGKALEFEWNDEVKTCGYLYAGQVLDSLKGSVEHLDFVTSDELTVGGEYLVAVRDLTEALRGEAGEEPDGEDAAYLACRTRYGRFASGIARLEADSAHPTGRVVEVEGVRMIPGDTARKATEGKVEWLVVKRDMQQALSQ